MEIAKFRRKIVVYTVLSIVVLFALLIILIFQYSQYWAMQAKQEELDRQLEYLTEQYDLFSAEYDYRTSDEFIEDYAREVLGWNR